VQTAIVVQVCADTIEAIINVDIYNIMFEPSINCHQSGWNLFGMSALGQLEFEVKGWVANDYVHGRCGVAAKNAKPRLSCKMTAHLRKMVLVGKNNPI